MNLSAFVATHLLLGIVAYDDPNMRVTNVLAANNFLRRDSAKAGPYKHDLADRGRKTHGFSWLSVSLRSATICRTPGT
jgi:hypothetical protein